MRDSAFPGRSQSFLELNRHRFTATEEDATQAVLGLAAGTIDEATFARWLRANVSRSPR